MKSTGRYSAHEEVSDAPKKPFLKDLNQDIEVIDLNFLKREGNEIKKKMITTLLESL